MSSFPYETPDVYIAAFLLSQGAKFISVTRVGKRRNIFRFESSEMLHELLRLYWRQDPYKHAPAQLFAALRRLKSVSRLHPDALHKTADQVVPMRDGQAAPDTHSLDDPTRSHARH
jgi:hypothetical protein